MGWVDLNFFWACVSVTLFGAVIYYERERERDEEGLDIFYI